MRVPLESWQVGPWNRWAYVHVGEVVETVPVPRGDGRVWQLDRGSAELDDLVDSLLESAYVDGLAIVHRGRLVAEHYGGEMTETALHLSQSVGKSVLGLLVGILVTRGALDPDEPVVERVPEVAGSGYSGATVQHLLDMTAAIDFVED
jgi:CubicO group peptidase (beta-lactamase class C family)